MKEIKTDKDVSAILTVYRYIENLNVGKDVHYMMTTSIRSIQPVKGTQVLYVESIRFYLSTHDDDKFTVVIINGRIVTELSGTYTDNNSDDFLKKFE